MSLSDVIRLGATVGLVALLTPMLVLPLAGSALAQPEIPAEALEHFESKIRPVLAERCYQCHGRW